MTPVLPQANWYTEELSSYVTHQTYNKMSLNKIMLLKDLLCIVV